MDLIIPSFDVYCSIKVMKYYSFGKFWTSKVLVFVHHQNSLAFGDLHVHCVYGHTFKHC